MSMIRFQENPLIRPADVKPSRDDVEVVCAFNCGCASFDGGIILLLRVAERPVHGPHEVVAPILHPDDLGRGLHFLRVDRQDPAFEDIDPRVFRYQGRTYLTSISHLRLARSADGRNFRVDDAPTLFPLLRAEEFGTEDPRITRIEDSYYINYSAVSRWGVATALAETRDFKTFERRGIIFAPDNRDVTIFPERIGGRYLCHHRPMAAMFGRQDIWLAESTDLLHWGNHRFVCACRPGAWDAHKVGGGAVPIRTERGWLSIYHGADESQRYCLGALLTDLEEPDKVLGRSTQPVLAPEADYERAGFFGNVVFSCGAIAQDDGRVIVYYGSSDEHTCAAETTVDDLLAKLD